LIEYLLPTDHIARRQEHLPWLSMQITREITLIFDIFPNQMAETSIFVNIFKFLLQLNYFTISISDTFIVGNAHRLGLMHQLTHLKTSHAAQRWRTPWGQREESSPRIPASEAQDGPRDMN
jgi:hypothetical protein